MLTPATSSRPALIVVGVALLGLTVSTLLLARVNLGGWNLVVALGIAGAKALLIALFFMHLRFSAGLTRLVLVGGLLWLGILLVGTADDYLTRHWAAIPGK
jgi:cytochrome c oxidase subunit 4